MKRFLQAMLAIAMVIMALGLTTNIFEPDPQKLAAEARAEQARRLANEIERQRIVATLNKLDVYHQLDATDQEHLIRVYTTGHGQAFADSLALCIGARPFAGRMAELPCLRQSIDAHLPWYAR